MIGDLIDLRLRLASRIGIRDRISPGLYQAVGQSDPNIFQEPKTVALEDILKVFVSDFYMFREHAWQTL